MVPSDYNFTDVELWQIFLALTGGTGTGSLLSEDQLYEVFNGNYAPAGAKIASLYEQKTGTQVSTADMLMSKLDIGIADLFVNSTDETITEVITNLYNLINTGTAHLGRVGGTTQRAVNSFTRPNNATAYAANDIVSNNAVLALDPAAIYNAGNGYITGARIVTDLAGLTPRLRLHLGNSATAFSVLTDNSANANTYTKLSNDAYIGYIDLPAMVSTGATGASFTQDNTQRVPYECAFGSTSLYGVIETLDAFTPTNNQNFEVKLFCEKN